MKKYLLIILSLVILFACNFEHKSNKEIRAEYKKEVEDNMYVGKIVGVVYLCDTTALVKGGDSAGGAVVGGGAAALMGFGPLGIVLGGAVGADAEKLRTIISLEEKLIIIAASGADTSYFEILFIGKYAQLGRFSQQSKPSLMQIYLSARPGSDLFIPTNRPLSRFAKIYSNYIFYKKENIPELD